MNYADINSNPLIQADLRVFMAKRVIDHPIIKGIDDLAKITKHTAHNETVSTVNTGHYLWTATKITHLDTAAQEYILKHLTNIFYLINYIESIDYAYHKLNHAYTALVCINIYLRERGLPYDLPKHMSKKLKELEQQVITAVHGS